MDEKRAGGRCGGGEERGSGSGSPAAEITSLFAHSFWSADVPACQLLLAPDFALADLSCAGSSRSEGEAVLPGASALARFQREACARLGDVEIVDEAFSVRELARGVRLVVMACALVPAPPLAARDRSGKERSPDAGRAPVRRRSAFVWREKGGGWELVHLATAGAPKGRSAVRGGRPSGCVPASAAAHSDVDPARATRALLGMRAEPASRTAAVALHDAAATLHLVRPHELLGVQAEEGGACVRCATGSFHLRGAARSLAARLESQGFDLLLVRRGVYLNPLYIDTLQGGVLTLAGGEHLRVSERMLRSVREEFERRSVFGCPRAGRSRSERPQAFTGGDVYVR